MLKQELSQTCICGQKMTFPEGQIKAKCLTNDCGANWELGAEGFWSITHISVNQQVDEAIKKFVRSMTEAFKKVYKAIKAAVKDINPKWLHYYKHSKKQRIRNKYRRKILTYIMNSLQPLRRENSLRKVGNLVE